MAASMQHLPVLWQAAVEALNVQPNGIYVDGTLGRGGHSSLILRQLNEAGRLIAFDKDQAALNAVSEKYAHDPRLHLVHGSFAQLAAEMSALGLQRKANGLLLDLGVSSPQLDDAGRGFSFMRDGPLDMRMDVSSGLSVAQWLQTVEEGELAQVIAEYGEERFARRIARAIVREREEQPILRTHQLAQLIERASPTREKHKHPATRTFQALRIFINRELDDLQICLRDSLKVLAQGARLVVISFHSLEDRIVKHFMREQSRGPRLPKGLPVVHTATTGALRLVGKAIKPDANEIAQNPRARSAVMRVAEVLV
jgi:16S rRNA (cytosine1402-N4)-methyltransferase